MSSREASPNSITYQYESNSPTRSPPRQCYPEHDILSKQKSKYSKRIKTKEITTPFYASSINYRKNSAKFAKLKRVMK